MLGSFSVSKTSKTGVEIEELEEFAPKRQEVGDFLKLAGAEESEGDREDEDVAGLALAEDADLRLTGGAGRRVGDRGTWWWESRSCAVWGISAKDGPVSRRKSTFRRPKARPSCVPWPLGATRRRGTDLGGDEAGDAQGVGSPQDVIFKHAYRSGGFELADDDETGVAGDLSRAVSFL